MKCPHCEKEINIGKLLGSIKTHRKSESSRRNGLKGGAKKFKKLTLNEMQKIHKGWVDHEDEIESELARKCQTPYCVNEGKEVLVQGLKAWLCEEHS